MIDQALLKHLGPRVVHVTARDNLPLIEEYGLLPAADLADMAGHDPERILLRRDRTRLATPKGVATLNHQNPINYGKSAADRIVEGYTAKTWAKYLDQRVFFFRKGGETALAGSMAADIPICTLTFDSETLLTHLADRVFLCPLNSGNFTQGGAKAKRGNWLFVPVTSGFVAFKENRQKRGLIKSKDTVKELCILGKIGPDVLRNLDMTLL